MPRQLTSDSKSFKKGKGWCYSISSQPKQGTGWRDGQASSGLGDAFLWSVAICSWVSYRCWSQTVEDGGSLLWVSQTKVCLKHSQGGRQELRRLQNFPGMHLPSYLVGSTFQIVPFANASLVGARNVAVNSKWHLYSRTLVFERLDGKEICNYRTLGLLNAMVK